MNIPSYAIMRFAKYKGPEISRIEEHNERTKETYASNPTVTAAAVQLTTVIGNIWVQGRTIPQMCQAFHEKMRMLEGVADSQADTNPASPLFEDYAQKW